jgi:hypothetical protein
MKRYLSRYKRIKPLTIKVNPTPEQLEELKKLMDECRTSLSIARMN